MVLLRGIGYLSMILRQSIQDIMICTMDFLYGALKIMDGNNN